MQTAATFIEKTGTGNKSACETFSRQLLPSFLLYSLALWKWPVPGSGLSYTSFSMELITYWASITHLCSLISWGRRNDCTAQPLTLSHTRRIWPLYNLGKCQLPTQFCRTDTVTSDLSIHRKAAVKQSQTRDFKKRGEMLCTTNTTLMSENGVFPTSVCSSKCLFLCLGSQTSSWWNEKQRLPGVSLGTAWSLNCLLESSAWVLSCTKYIGILWVCTSRVFEKY